MSATTLLVIEDEAAIRSLLDYTLQAESFNTLLCDDATPALNLLKKTTPDLILLDWMLPSMSGIDFIRKIKKQSNWQHIPIIMLTARAQEENKITGLETGADDYITKPFSPKELVARIKTVLRRGILRSPDDKIMLGNYHLNLTKQVLYHDQQPIKLNPNSLRLLKFLATHPNRPYSRAQLLDLVWGADKELDERSVDAEIKRLRQSLSTEAKLIKTIRGIGYQLNLDHMHD